MPHVAIAEGTNQVTEIIQVRETVEEEIRRIAKEENFKDIEKLVRIAKCESGLKPTAKNPNSTATGVFQILRHGDLTTEQRESVEFSTHWAIKHWNNGAPWASSINCWK
jgi:hypothetical protein